MHYIGIDLGGTNIKAGLVDSNSNITFKCSIPTKKTTEGILSDIAFLVRDIESKAGVPIHSVGLGYPGICSDSEGILKTANNLPLDNIPFKNFMKKHTDLPVYIGNDANCATWGEYCMLPEKPFDMVMITLGTGVGGGAVLGGKIYEGYNKAAMEAGHILLYKDGAECSCGRRGCFEAYASVTALIRQTKEYISVHPSCSFAKMPITGQTAFDAARNGDTDGIFIVDKWCEYIAEGVFSLINLFAPKYFIIGGAVSREGDFLLNNIKKHLKLYYDTCPNISKTIIKTAVSANDAGLIGAAFLGRKEDK